MEIKRRLISALIFALTTPAYAAMPIDVAHQPVSSLKSFFNPSPMGTVSSSLKEISREQDMNQTTHIRYKQLYAGVPVWGGEIIIHQPRGEKLSFNNSSAGVKATGFIINSLEKDLGQGPRFSNIADQSQNALRHAIQLFQQKTGNSQVVTQEKSDLMVYLDEKNKAHWAFLVSFFVDSKDSLPTRPNYIIDAHTFDVYENWDGIQTMDDVVNGGGFGGNQKIGRLTYDGLQNNYPYFPIKRNTTSKICSMENTDVSVGDYTKNNAIVTFNCDAPNAEHNQVYWSGDLDAANGGYSPSNDAMYAGIVVKNMYLKWYGIPVITKDGKAVSMVMNVHKPIDNAFWDDKTQTMTFGDGVTMFYPLVALDVGGHEISHGFTSQHSDLVYLGQSGGMNESYSDMAGEAAKYYSRGTNDWKVGATITKDDTALRYMDDPTKDCAGKPPGSACSIDNAKDFKRGMNVHYSSGVYNKAFYLMSTSPNWNTKKAFDVMVQANRFYWTQFSNFSTAACGVISATKDLKYDEATVQKAFLQVGIKTMQC